MGLTIFHKKFLRSSGRVAILALGAAFLAFVDGRDPATHLLPSGIWQLVVRPLLFLGAILCLAALGGELLDLLEPLQPDTVTVSWDSSENGWHSFPSLAYPAFTDGVEIATFASTALLGLFFWWFGRSTSVLLDRQE